MASMVKKILFILLALNPLSSRATNLQNAYLYDAAGNGITSQVSNTKRALDIGIDVNGAQVDPRTRSWSLLNTTDSVNAVQSGTWNITVGNFPTTFAISNFPATQAVSAASLPLPTGASTSSLQTTGNISLASIDTKLTSPITVTGTVTGTNSANGNTGSSVPTQATQVAGNDGTNLRALKVSTAGVLSVDGSAVVQPVSQSGTWNITNVSGTVSLPTGAATSALQTTGNASLSSIDTKTPALGQALAAASVPVVLTAAQISTLTPLTIISTKAPVNANATLSPRQTVTTSESTLSAPANTVGVILECESVNADNVRWGFSNAATAILSSTLGMLCEPGRDSGMLPMGAGTVLHLISTGSGSDFVGVQWVLSQ